MMLYSVKHGEMYDIGFMMSQVISVTMATGITEKYLARLTSQVIKRRQIKIILNIKLQFALTTHQFIMQTSKKNLKWVNMQAQS